MTIKIVKNKINRTKYSCFWIKNLIKATILIPMIPSITGPIRQNKTQKVVITLSI
jgi:hypothetical protein